MKPRLVPDVEGLILTMLLPSGYLPNVLGNAAQRVVAVQLVKMRNGFIIQKDYLPSPKGLKLLILLHIRSNQMLPNIVGK